MDPSPAPHYFVSLCEVKTEKKLDTIEGGGPWTPGLGVHGPPSVSKIKKKKEES